MGWKEGEMDLVWDRSVSKADGNQLTLDAPLTMALDNKWGTVKVLRYSWPGRIAEAGLENLTLASDYDKKYPKDEDHCGWLYLCQCRQLQFPLPQPSHPSVLL